MTRPKSDFDALRQDLHRIYEGDPWHGSSIITVLKGINAEVAEKGPSRVRQYLERWSSIWRCGPGGCMRVRGAGKDPPEDWPVPRSGGGEKAWQAPQDDLAAPEELESAVDALGGPHSGLERVDGALELLLGGGESSSPPATLFLRRRIAARPVFGRITWPPRLARAIATSRVHTAIGGPAPRYCAHRDGPFFATSALIPFSTVR